MHDPHSKILQRNRLRPQKKGKLPNFTKEFEQYTQQINQAIRNQVCFSFQLNKYDIKERRKTSQLKKIVSIQSKFLTEKSDVSTTQKSSRIHLPEKHLKYNQTRIMPDHKIKIRKKICKKQNRQNSLPIIYQFKQHKDDESYHMNQLLNINFTERKFNNNKKMLLDKQNDPLSSKSSRAYLSCKNQSQSKFFQIFRTNKKQIYRQIFGPFF